LVKLRVAGEEFLGINGHGQRTSFERVNAQTKTHAEADAVQQALNAGLKGSSKRAELWADRAPCDSCGKYGGLRSLARELGVDSLVVNFPGGKKTVTPTK